MSRTVYVSLSAAALAIVGTLVFAGPLSPPSGTIASTYKTLTEVEPRIAINATNTPGDALNSFIISQPGSYYLTGNITGVSGKSGIKIAASNVTLDLNGFTLQGVAGSQYGILAQVFPNNCTVRNGVVAGWGLSGVFISSPGGSGRGSLIENLHSYGNTGSGISAADGSIVRTCVAINNGNGIVALANCLITQCTAISNTSIGISCNSGTIDNCVAKDNGSHGISCGSTIVRGNTCTSNGVNVTDGCGILAIGNGRIESNDCVLNDIGIKSIGDSNRIDSNSCSNNSTSFLISGLNNLVIRNSATGGAPNYNIVAGNSVAPLIGVVGNNNWPAVANSNHPMANYGY